MDVFCDLCDLTVLDRDLGGLEVVVEKNFCVFNMDVWHGYVLGVYVYNYICKECFWALNKEISAERGIRTPEGRTPHKLSRLAPYR